MKESVANSPAWLFRSSVSLSSLPSVRYIRFVSLSTRLPVFAFVIPPGYILIHI